MTDRLEQPPRSLHVTWMDRPLPPQIDMTPDGRFRLPPRPGLAVRIGGVALIVAVGAGALAAALLALWLALSLVPIAIGAALVAWVAFKLRGGRLGGLRGSVYPRPPNRG